MGKIVMGPCTMCRAGLELEEVQSQRCGARSSLMGRTGDQQAAGFLICEERSFP